MKKRKDSFIGLHFDFHATQNDNAIGSDLNEADIREICRLLHPDFIQIDCKGHPGWASYPSEIGNAVPGIKTDTLALWRKVTREEGVALYMHYSGVMDARYCKEHPEEARLNADGNRDLKSVCVIGKYADEILIPQLKELAGKYGVDGVWVDGECWGTAPDYDPRVVEAFETETGIRLCGTLPKKKGDTSFEEYRDFCRELFRRYVNYYVDVVHAEYPDFQIASNWAYTDHMPEAVSSNVDFLSGDLDPNVSFNAARYAGRAIAQQNKTWDLMSWNFRTVNSGKPAYITKHPVQITQEACEVISLGGGYQNYIPQSRTGAPRMDQIRKMKPVFDFLRIREPFCHGGRLVHQTAVLMSTYDRHLEAEGLYGRDGYRRLIGLSSLICDCSHSLEVVSEHTVAGRYGEYPVIIIPELYKGLEKKTIDALLRYAANGGSLILTGQNTCKVFSEHGAPFGVGNLFEDDRQFTYDGNDFGSVVGARTVYPDKGTPICYATDLDHKKSDTIGAVMQYGRGLITAVGFDIGSQYENCCQYIQKNFMNYVLSYSYRPIVTVKSCEGTLEITDMELNGRLMIQLVNANGHHMNRSYATEDRIQPCRDIELALRLPHRPTAMFLQPDGGRIDAGWNDGIINLRLDRVDFHQTIEICF